MILSNSDCSDYAADFSPATARQSTKSLAHLLAIALSQSVDVVSGGSDLESVQKWREIIGLVQGIWIFAFVAKSVRVGWWEFSTRLFNPLWVAMLQVLQHLLLCRFVAFQLIGDDHSWCKALFFQQFTLIIASEPLCLDAAVAKHPARSPPCPLLATNSIAASWLSLPPRLNAIYRQHTGVGDEVDWRTAARISDTILESFRRSLQSPGTASSFRHRGSSTERCSRARRSSWWFQRGIGGESTWAESRESSRRSTILLL